MVIKSIAEKDYYEYDEPKGLQWTGFSGFYIFISKLPITDKEETIEHYFSLSIVTPKVDTQQMCLISLKPKPVSTSISVALKLPRL